MNDEVEAKIEFQKVIGEANSGGYQPVRFTRVKYKASPTAHIDIRQFQRAPGDEEDEEDKYYPTKKGFRFPEREFRKVVEKYALMPETYVHALIVEKCFSLLNSQEFESAVLQAFKAIETSVRTKIGAPSELFGTRLLRKAFNPDTGILTNYSIPKSERDAFCNYICGAFSYYRNPSSHRDIDMDFIGAFDKIVVASDLLKTIESSEVSEQNQA
ncbi:MAG: TIGR02391 family protein [Pseudomonadales bacterium]|nr:TIGR02391 family protein [Pseudomonadales bacterium]|tara:strand:+ start:342 stop:983 length:642 start_codon:yes stop_codon:yes gene_type:complete